MKLQKTTRGLVALGTIGVMSFGGFIATATPAHAKSSTWKKAAIAAGVVTGYGLVKHKGKVATVGAVATAGSYYMYKRSKKKEEARKRWYQQRYGRNWQSHYRSGH